jgi:hypothetical protein
MMNEIREVKNRGMNMEEQQWILNLNQETKDNTRNLLFDLKSYMETSSNEFLTTLQLQIN